GGRREGEGRLPGVRRPLGERRAHRRRPPGVAAASGAELVQRALAGLLVVAEAQDLRPVADPPTAHVVEGHLDDQLRAQLDPLELAPGAPAARLAGAPPAGLEPGEHRRKLALLLRAEAGAVADDVELAGLVVEPEDEGADGPLVLARPP